ncbi:MAG: AAA family ATPase, partial [Anaerolineae bacterium]
QILFQSAAGIASFGAVREALEEEADSLWAKRRAGDREYYIAADELARAQETLKQVTVRTRDWVSARDEVERLQQEAAETRARYEALAQRRARLERVRRVAPVLTGLREREGALEALGPVRRLAADAARQLDEAERVMALAAQARRLHETQAAELSEAQARISPNTGILARNQDIEALAAQRHQVRNHPADVAKRQEEARAHWKTLEGLARELGWPAEREEALAARIPSQVTRSAAGALVRRHDTLVQALENAKEAQAVKRGEVTELDQALARLPATELPPELVAALDAARALGDVAAQERRLSGQVERAERELADARAALGPWQAELDRLRRLHLPGSDDVNALREGRHRLRSEAESLTQRIHEERAAIADLDLEITQYQAAHHPVSLADLAAAREARDGLWQEIRSGTAPLAEAADPYEGLVGEADALADRRHDKAQEAATLQSKLDGRERRARQLDLYESRAEENRQRQGLQAAEWEARMEAIGLPGMTLDQMGPWCTARDRVLAAAEALEGAQAELKALHRQAEQARAGLAAALVPPPEPGELLAALVLRAAKRVEEIRRADERRTALQEQRAGALSALESLARRLAQAQEAIAAWRDEWAHCLGSLHLPAETGTGAAEGALAVLARMDDHLYKMRELRDARINPMRRDLDAF